MGILSPVSQFHAISSPGGHMPQDFTPNPVFDPANPYPQGQMQQNATECNNTSPPALSEVQIRAIELILQGLGDARIAKILEINRCTLWRWRSENFDFR